MKSRPFLTPSLLKSLTETDGERSAAGFLARNPILLRWAFGSTGGHSSYVLHEFPIGINFKADFVVLSSWSGAWEVVFVELEPVSERLVTKQGNPSRRLAGAIKQIVDWDNYVVRNRATIQQDLADRCMKRDLLKWSPHGSDPINYSSNRLRDVRTNVHFKYGIAAGRRSKITAEARSQADRFANRLDLTLRSYDVFVDIAKKLDSVKRNPNQSVCLVDFAGR